ncbi:MAG: hypothetical protein HY650_07785 [Acidobacteria bacterium]|nr:hypothetical protein [Acidobacteriota bacterium]
MEVLLFQAIADTALKFYHAIRTRKPISLPGRKVDIATMTRILINRMAVVVILLTAVALPCVGQESPRQPPPTGKPGEGSRATAPGISFGGRVREEVLENPYRFHSTPAFVTDAVKLVLSERDLEIDDSRSRIREGVIVTQWHVFAKGISTVSELARVSHPPAVEAHSWDSARYLLEIRIVLAEANLTLVSVNAIIEGRARGIMSTSWLRAESKGVLENEILIALRGKVEVR